VCCCCSEGQKVGCYHPTLELLLICCAIHFLEEMVGLERGHAGKCCFPQYFADNLPVASSSGRKYPFLLRMLYYSVALPGGDTAALGIVVDVAAANIAAGGYSQCSYSNFPF